MRDMPRKVKLESVNENSERTMLMSSSSWDTSCAKAGQDSIAVANITEFHSTKNCFKGLSWHVYEIQTGADWFHGPY